MLDKALETNSTQYLNFDKKKRLLDIDWLLERPLFDAEKNELEKERNEILRTGLKARLIEIERLLLLPYHRVEIEWLEEERLRLLKELKDFGN